MCDLYLQTKILKICLSEIHQYCSPLFQIEELQEKTEHELKIWLADKQTTYEEFYRLCRALHNLKKYTGKKYFTVS